MALFQSNNDDYTHRKIIISVYIVLKLSSSPWKILIKLKIEHENSKKILENNRIGTRNKSPLQKVSGIKVLSKFLNFSKLLQSKQNNFSSIFPDSCGNLWTISLFRNPVKWLIYHKPRFKLLSLDGKSLAQNYCSLRNLLIGDWLATH